MSFVQYFSYKKSCSNAIQLPMKYQNKYLHNCAEVCAAFSDYFGSASGSANLDSYINIDCNSQAL